MRTRRLRIVLSSHARSQLRERELSASMVSDAVRHPSEVVEGRMNRKVAHKLVRHGRGTGLLRVVYAEEKDAVVVITVYRTAKISRYLGR